jgi:hypothetical protein
MFIPRAVRSDQRFRFVFVAALSGLATTTVLALNTDTHRLVNQRAVEASATFDEYLRSKAGFPGGSETKLHARTIREWIEEGGIREDDFLRFLRHFHDPLKPWDTAGLDFVIDRHDSSVRWMQERNQGGLDTSGFWSWHDARRLYYQALVEPDAKYREALWADLFRALGQIMHLVVDASVPEHVRNDMHPVGGLTLTSSYEYWVSRQHPTPPLEDAFVARFLSAPIGFIPDILQLLAPSGEHIAKVPVARLIDADRYDGSNPGVTAHPIDPRAPVSAGLAEIANANFYSENTFRTVYPSPTDQGLIRINLDTPLGRVRRYLSRPASLGLLPANPLRAECASDAYGGAPTPYPCMDGAVWNQVAAHMLPRAVGYASGVLDYFFRGAISVTRVEWTASGITLRVRNDGTEEMEGTFEVFARHQPGSAVERRTRLAVLEDGEPVLLGPGEEWWFDLAVPPDIVPAAAHVLVFKGRLGLEEDAVVGQVFTVPYVEVRQTRYDADLTPSCERRPPSVVSPPYPSGVTTTIQSESMRCEWRVVNHRVSGEFETNTWRDPETGRREPIIDRIEAEWIGGDVQGPAPLTLDGMPVGSMWQRTGDEPDPATFAVVDPVDRGRSYLFLTVTYVDGAQVMAQQAIFTWPVSSHGKQLVLDNRNPSSPQYLVVSTRSVSGLVAYNWATTGQMLQPLFEPVSHGGRPAPSDQHTERRFGGSRVFREGLTISQESYSDAAIDDFEVFASGDPAFARYAALEPLVSPHPNGPVYPPVAEVRRVYQPMEREFLRAFVTADPQPYVVSLAAESD